MEAETAPADLDLALGRILGRELDDVRECARVEEHGGEVLEDDPRLREVGDVADVGAQVHVGGCLLCFHGPS